jgi:hypothetical protein
VKVKVEKPITLKDMERRFSIAIDTRDMLKMQIAALENGIGLQLLEIFRKNQQLVKRKALLQQVRLMVQSLRENCPKDMPVNFFGLEFIPHAFHPRPTRLELDKILGNIRNFVVESGDIYRDAAQNFFNDPSALGDGRLYFGPMTRM